MTREHSANNSMDTKTDTTTADQGAAVLVGSGPSLGSVFELVEILQCEDQYYPLGLFLTLADAVAVVEYNGVGVCTMDPEEWAGVEIRERKIGLSSNGKTVWTRSWERNFADEDDAADEVERWKVIQPSGPNAEMTNARERRKEP